MLSVLLLGGGFVYWFGLIRAQWPMILTGAAALLLALGLLIEAGGISLLALPALAVAGVWAYALKRFSSRIWLMVGWTVFGIFLLTLGFRIVPYFNPVELLPPLATEVYAFRPEKLVLILLAPPMVLVPWSRQTQARFSQHPALVSLLILFALVASIMSLVLAFTGVRLGFTQQAPMHVFYLLSYNLLFTCLLEEAFFRGMLQPALLQAFAKRFNARRAAIFGIGLAAILFGLAHIAGGPAFMVLATLAGVGYGLAYHWTGRLYIAVLVHFGFNAVRFLLFAGSN